VAERDIIRIDGVDREFHRYKIIFVLLMPLAMALMAISSVNVALPAMSEGLGATDSDLQWVLSGYGLALGVSLIPSGRAGDVLGRGMLFIIGLSLFVVASLACGLAPSADFLNIARIVQGFAAGVFNPQVVGMIQQYFSGKGRAKAFALFGLTISVSVAIGPIVTGSIISALGPEAGWRWAFLVNIPIGVIGVILAFFWFPFETERLRWAQRHSPHSDRLDLDPIGTIILTVAIFCIMFPFIAKSGWLWGILALAPLLLWFWVWWERRYQARGREPMVDLRLFTFPSFRNGTLIAGTMFLGVASTFAVVAIFLQSGMEIDALKVGLIGLPNALASAYSAMWSVKYVWLWGRKLAVCMLALMVVGTVATIAVVVLIPHGVPWWVMGATLALSGFAMGAFGSVNQTLSLEDVPVQHGGTAGGIKQTVERTGAALGNAIVTGVFFGFVTHGWTAAFALAFGVVALFMAIALAIAVYDERTTRTATPTSAA